MASKYPPRPFGWRNGRRGLVASLVLIPLAMAPSNVALAQDTPKPASEAKPDAQSTENIDPTILATMQEQAKLQPAVQALYEEYVKAPNSGFAGVAFEGPGLTLYFKGSLTTSMTSAVARARAYGPIKVSPAAHSKSELEANAAKISDTIKSRGNSDIQAVSVEHNGSGLVIERIPATQSAQIATRRAAKGKAPIVPAASIIRDAGLSVPVQVTTGEKPIELMASRIDDFSAWNGGGRWESWRNGSLRGTCTTGWGVKNGAGTKFVLTAAHCATAPDIARQGQGSTLETMGPVHSENWGYDIILIGAQGSGLIFDGTATTSNTKPVRSWGYWAANELVCQSGSTSGTICGLKQLNSTDITFNCCDSDGDQGYTVKGLIKTTRTAGGTAVRGGDSGGPVFTLDGTGVRAKGITSAGSGSTMYFQDWADIAREYGAYPVTQ
ncbi:S1 family peptidase [Micromonospora taraxaci]